MLARRGRQLAKLPHKIISMAGKVGDTSTSAPPLPYKNLQFLSPLFFVAWELMDLVNHQGFLAAQRLPMATARMNLTTTATEHDKTAPSAAQDAATCPGGISVAAAMAGSKSIPW